MSDGHPNCAHAIIYFDDELQEEDGNGWILECSTWNILSYRFPSLAALTAHIANDPYWVKELTRPSQTI